MGLSLLIRVGFQTRTLSPSEMEWSAARFDWSAMSFDVLFAGRFTVTNNGVIKYRVSDFG